MIQLKKTISLVQNIEIIQQKISTYKSQEVPTIFSRGHIDSHRIPNYVSPKLWEGPTGFLIPLKKDSAEVSLTRLNTVFESNTTIRENPNNNFFIEFIYYIGLQINLFSDKSTKETVLEKIANKYFVQLALNTVPYGCEDSDSFFNEFHFEIQSVSMDSLLNLDADKIQNINPQIRHMIEMVLWIFTLFCFDNVIDDGIVVRSNERILDYFTSELPKVITGERTSGSVLGEIDKEITKAVDSLNVSDLDVSEIEKKVKIIQKERSEIDFSLKLATLLEVYGNFRERFLSQITAVKDQSKYSEAEKINNYLMTKKIFREKEWSSNKVFSIQFLELNLNNAGKLNQDILKSRIDILKSDETQKYIDFIQQATNYFRSSVREMETGTSAITISDYIDIRRVSGAIRTVFSLAELEDERLMYSPDYLLHNYFYVEHERAAVDVIWGVNDKASEKEWNSHEPNYIKIAMINNLKVMKNIPGEFDVKVVVAFKLALIDLLTLISDRNQDFTKYTKKIGESIRSGKIFDNNGIGFFGYSPRERDDIIHLVLQDFNIRTEIKSNLIAAGNERIKGNLYYDPSDPFKNVIITENFPDWILPFKD